MIYESNFCSLSHVSNLKNHIPITLLIHIYRLLTRGYFKLTNNQVYLMTFSFTKLLNNYMGGLQSDFFAKIFIVVRLSHTTCFFTWFTFVAWHGYFFLFFVLEWSKCFLICCICCSFQWDYNFWNFHLQKLKGIAFRLQFKQIYLFRKCYLHAKCTKIMLKLNVKYCSDNTFFLFWLSYCLYVEMLV